MDIDPQQEIDSLKAQIEQIRTQFHLLLSQEDPASIKYTREIERATEERNQDVDDARDNEKKSAEMLYQGFIYQMDDDHEMASLNISERLIDLLRIKYTAITENFPHASKYFKKMNTEFLNEIYKEKAYDPNNFDGYSVELSSDPIVEENDVKKVQDPDQNSKHFYVKESTLYHGNKQFTIGTNIIWTIPSNPHFSVLCTIRDITPHYIELNIDDSLTKRIKIEALRDKVCKIKRA